MSIFKRIIRWLGILIVSVTFTVILAVSIQTQRVIGGLEEIGASVPIGERIGMTAYDVMHLGSLFGIFVFIALFVAFLAAGFLCRFIKLSPPFVYSVAGAVAVIIMLMIMKRAFFDVHIIAGARDGIGIALQALCGALGGYIFALLLPKIATH